MAQGWNGASARRRQSPRVEHIDFGRVALVFLVFSLVCFITSYVFSSSDTVASFAAHPNDTIGPIKTEKADTVIDLTVHQPQTTLGWSNLEIVLLKADKKTRVLSLGDEFYFESGRDSEGTWVERKQQFETNFTIPEAGEYYFLIQGTASSPNTQAANIIVRYQYGSTLPHFWAGLVSLLLGVSLYFAYKNNYLS